MESNKKPVEKEKEIKLIQDVSEIKEKVQTLLDVVIGESKELQGKRIETMGIVDHIKDHSGRLQTLETAHSSLEIKIEEERKKKKWLRAGVTAGAGAAGVGTGFGFKAFIAWITSIFL